MFTLSVISGLILLISVHTFRAQYVPPEALVEPLKPIGFRISIPHEPGISLVAFHVKFNVDFNGLEAGTIAKDIIKHKYDRWTYEDRSTELKKNDDIYYWIHVVYKGLGYNLVNQEHKVFDFYDYNGQKIEAGDDDVSIVDQIQPCVSSMTNLFDENGASEHPCAGQLLFQDSFNDRNQFQRMHWTVVQQFSSTPDYEFVVYQNADENLKIENGLRITPTLLSNKYNNSFFREGNLTLENCTGRLKSADCYREARGWNILPHVSSSRINTKRALNFEYGRVEIRAKLPCGDWIYPLLLLEPVKNVKGTSLETVQIRIASSAGNVDLKSRNGEDISGHMLWGGITGLNPISDGHFNDNVAKKYNAELWSNRFHTYELIWNPKKVVLKVDGESFDEKETTLPRDTPFYLTLGIAVGGLSEFADHCISRGANKTWRNIEAKALYHFFNTTDTWCNTWQNDAISLRVDYIKIWAL